MESSKEKILREFDKEIDEGFLRGASSAEQLVGIKRFISHTLSNRKAKLKEGAKSMTVAKLVDDIGENDLVRKSDVLQLIEEVL